MIQQVLEQFKKRAEDATPLEGSFIVNIGDVLQGWSEHFAKKLGIEKLRSTPHRVINKSSEKTRISLAFFYDPNLEMKMPEGVNLKREGDAEVNNYGDHIFRSYAKSYPDVMVKN